LPTFAATAAKVVGVEPHGELAEAARRRTKDMANVEVRQLATIRV
jgi:protein-L-isoaspartate O-methyltransferase